MSLGCFKNARENLFYGQHQNDFLQYFNSLSMVGSRRVGTIINSLNFQRIIPAEAHTLRAVTERLLSGPPCNGFMSGITPSSSAFESPSQKEIDNKNSHIIF